MGFVLPCKVLVRDVSAWSELALGEEAWDASARLIEVFRSEAYKNPMSGQFLYRKEQILTPAPKVHSAPSPLALFLFVCIIALTVVVDCEAVFNVLYKTPRDGSNLKDYN
jgi:hypothetical protein